jgi:hypothetical protein
MGKFERNGGFLSDEKIKYHELDFNSVAISLYRMIKNTDP